MLKTLHTQRKKKNVRKKIDIHESKEKIRAHRASSKATRLLRSIKSNINQFEERPEASVTHQLDKRNLSSDLSSFTFAQTTRVGPWKLRYLNQYKTFECLLIGTLN